jgi:predicted XRE-type DNA-binding protein
MVEIKRAAADIYSELGRVDAAEMRVKATLAAAIGDIIKSCRLTQVEAAAILGIPQPKLSGMLRGRFRGISETKMIECMNRLGRDIEIVVRKSPASRSLGRTRVVFAPSSVSASPPFRGTPTERARTRRSSPG